MKAALNNLAGAGLPALGVKRPWLVTVMNLLIALAGFVAIFAIEVRELPDVDQPVVNVRANFPGASPETMDSEVTRILEGAVARVSGVKEVNSNSEEGSSRIRAVFNSSSNVDRAAADVREAVSRVQRQLPENVEQLAVFKSDEDAEEIMRIAVLADGVTEQDLAKIVERDVVPAFISLPGVADVPLFGSRRQILRVELDPGRMSTYGLTVTDIRSVLSQAPLDVPAGSFKTNDQTLLVRADASVESEEDIGNLLITDKIRLRDVARVAYTPDDATSVVRLNGQRVLGVGVVRQAGSNTIQISEGARKAIAQFNAQRDDIKLQVISDEAVFINGAVSEVVRTLGFAVIIVILTIRLFSGSWRFTIVPAIAIPISLLGTLAASWALGFSINILTLLALVLATGLIVDDAIVVLESVQRRQQKGEGASAAAVLGTQSVFFAVIATTMVLVAVFVPIAFLPGTSGRLFREFGLVLTVAVAISSFVALSLVPALMARLGKPENVGLEAIQPNLIQRLYSAALHTVLNFPLMSIIVSVGLAAAAASVYTSLDSELLPTEDRGKLNMFARGPAGVGLPYTERQSDQIEAIFQPYLESGVIDQLYTVAGRWDPNIIYVVGTLKPWNEREMSQQELAAEIQPELNQLPGVTARIYGSNSLNIRGSWRGGIQFVLLGNDYEEIYAAARVYADAIRARLTSVQSPRIDYTPSQAQVAIRIDRERLADLNVSINELAQTLRVMVDGVRVVDLNGRDQSIPVVLKAGQNRIQGPNDLVNLFVRSQEGQLIPLSSLVTVVEEGVPDELRRLYQRRSISIDMQTVDGVDLQTAVDDLTALANEVVPSSITVVPEGEAARLGESQRDSFYAYGLALLIVFLVLVAQFESLTSALVIMTIVPFGLAAAIFALFITGNSLNVYSQVGLVMLIGLIAKNGILLVEFADQRRDAGASVRDAIEDAANIRLRPIAMTLISTVLGALPLILSSGPGSEAREAVGWVVFGGLGLTAIFTLFLTPVIYLALARFSKPRADARLKLERELGAATDL
ncbi:efflux RND transporter permease subunit [Luminiphilus sp.]|nr:efflux RND transporter permease subunit [Luminiphilus sp.]MDA8945956.1 efflux RND transporter permease subunit [Luminiphilus sp.]MDA9915767.1 efflux RND transporter permease subunit [Luminiphilus sp.]MDB2316686.1 efflux RND transporter permease subunit [Luminiphilus sp.]MDB2379608.1 efflux RND transporter permease subunit [Luminiphilus sp.]